jgi:long-chain acyl-CoA synthetase
MLDRFFVLEKRLARYHQFNGDVKRLATKPKIYPVSIQSASNPLEVFIYWERNVPDQLFLRQPVNGVYQDWTYRQAGEESRKIANALRAYNLPPKSHIAILSKNCAHWIMSDLAIWMAGHISVPLYPTLSANSIRQILSHSGSKILFIGKLDNFAEQESGIPPDVQCISYTLFGEKKGASWEALTKKYAPLADTAQLAAEDLATIKYTSGTTGNPKGVMISFGAFHNIVPGALEKYGVQHPAKFFSYLPLSHIAERMLVECGALYSGSEIHFSESLEKFPENLMTTQPTVFLAVPRIWTKFREKIEQKMPKLDRLLKIPLISSVIKKAIRKKLGLSKATLILSGAAPISVDLLKWFKKLDITIQEVYGMTENLAYSHTNFKDAKFGTVGRAWYNVEAKISEEGELLVKHSGLMKGYYREPEMTRKVFTEDGFLKTGDKGEVDRDGFLTITGRIKDQFKTDKAKFVDPGPIELKFLSNSDVEQVCVVGMGIPQPIALVILSASGKQKEKSLVEESLKRTMDAINPDLESYERLKAAIILSQDWTVENGLMTPTLKVKRNEVEKIYLPKYPQWYEKNLPVIWE